MMISRRSILGMLAGLPFMGGILAYEARKADVRHRAEKAIQEVLEANGIVKDVYLAAGEQITCERGHPVCVVATDIKRGDYYDHGQFRDWRQPEPSLGVREQPCIVCGSKWFRGTQLHVDGVWRT